MGDRPQRVNPIDDQPGRARTRDPGAHLAEHHADVHDLRLAGGIVDLGRTLGQHRGHQQVLGGPDAGEIEPDRGAVQALR